MFSSMCGKLGLNKIQWCEALGEKKAYHHMKFVDSGA